MIHQRQLTGAVLAGGHSRRMGCDKALLVVDGEPLWARQTKLLRTAGAVPVGVIRREDQPALSLPGEIPLWFDSMADAGPLAGLHAALLACRTPFVAVVAIDLPHLDAAWFTWLADFCRPDCGAIVRHATGAFEPLAAIYPHAALAEVGARLGGADFSLQGLAATLAARRQLVAISVPEARRSLLHNWNSPSDRRPFAVA